MNEANLTRHLERKTGEDPRLLELRSVVEAMTDELRSGEGDAESGRNHWENFVSRQ